MLVKQVSQALPLSSVCQTGKVPTGSRTKDSSPAPGQKLAGKAAAGRFCVPSLGSLGLRLKASLSFLPQLVRYSSEGVLQLGPLGSTAFLPDSKCLVDDGKGRTPTLKKCEDVLRPAQRFWDFTQVWKSSGSLAEINWRGMLF